MVSPSYSVEYKKALHHLAPNPYSDPTIYGFPTFYTPMAYIALILIYEPIKHTSILKTLYLLFFLTGSLFCYKHT